MRRCCCCVSAHVGAVVLGLLAAVLAALALVVLIPFLADFHDFNPIKDNINNGYYLLENLMEEQHVPKNYRDEAMTFIHEWIWTILLVTGCLAGFYSFIGLLMAVGVVVKKKALILPYLIFELVLIVIFVLVGSLLCVLLFFVGIVLGSIAVGVFIVTAFIFIYFWRVVQKSYKELANQDFDLTYTVPVRPIYNPKNSH